MNMMQKKIVLICIFQVFIARRGLTGNPRATQTVNTQYHGAFHTQITIQCIGKLPGSTEDIIITANIVQNENIGSIVWWKGSNLVDKLNATKYSGGTLSNPELTITDLLESDASGYECTCSANSFTGARITVVIVNNIYGDSGESDTGKTALYVGVGVMGIIGLPLLGYGGSK